MKTRLNRRTLEAELFMPRQPVSGPTNGTRISDSRNAIRSRAGHSNDLHQLPGRDFDIMR
jgi:hypothetical protein